MKPEKHIMSVETDAVVGKLRPSLEKAISEAVVNSIQAQATEITVNIHYFENLTLNFIEVIDNGVGFTKVNRNSFFKVYSAHKRNTGGKGIGRFCWLKFFKNVTINSNFKVGNDFEHTTFDFNAENESFEVKFSTPNSNVNKTTVSMYEYLLGNKLVNLKDTLKNYLLKEMLMMLYASGNDIKINLNFFENKQLIHPDTLSGANIPDLSYNKDFFININNKDVKFTLKSIEINYGKEKIETSIIAGSRSISNFKEAFGLNITPPIGGQSQAIHLFLESSLFDDVNYISDDRERINLPKSLMDNEEQDVKKSIANHLAKAINTFFDEKFPETLEIKNKIIEEIFELYPQYREEHFESIISRELINTIGRIDKKSLLNKLHQEENSRSDRFKAKYARFLSNKNINKLTIDKIAEMAEETTEQAKSSLSNYFWYRKAVIQQLELLIDDNEKSEDLLHRLFYKPKDTSQKFDLQNCIWLLDDKFMNFSYFASDIEIKKILLDIYGEHEYDENSKKRPDIFMAFNAVNDENIKDCVVIEFKALGTTADEKANAASQVRRKYVQSVRKHTKNVRYVFVYIITDIDDQLANGLEYDDFTPAMTRYGKIFTSYVKKGDAYICFLCAKAIIGDAKDRHELFFRLLREELEIRTELK